MPQVIKYESVIHEFDPYFNFRVTQVGLRGASILCVIIFVEYADLRNLARIIGDCNVVLISECWCQWVLGFAK